MNTDQDFLTLVEEMQAIKKRRVASKPYIRAAENSGLSDADVEKKRKEIKTYFAKNKVALVTSPNPELRQFILENKNWLDTY